MNKKGFTLIELLAVIIILGILMIIAIPSVTRYISDSRKSSYVDSAKEIIGSARNLVNSGELEMYDTDATYYIDVNCIKTENAMKSPYGEFVKEGAYVVVTYDGKGYDYFWTSVDDAGQGVKNIVKYDKLDTDDISSDLTIDDISTLRTLDGRGKVILITERNSCKKEGAITENLIPVNSETGEEGGSSGGGSSSNAVVYPTGKNKSTVVVGDVVTIGTEDFYVVSNDGTDLVLLAHYNLNVGSNIISDAIVGIQNENATGNGGISCDHKPYTKFSSSNYWNGKVGTEYLGSYCSSNNYNPNVMCASVLDENSYLFDYLSDYKDYLEDFDVTIKKIRLLRAEELFELGCGQGKWSCKDSPANGPEWIYETTYWLETSFNSSALWCINENGNIEGCYYVADCEYGVRPVIVI